MNLGYVRYINTIVIMITMIIVIIIIIIIVIIIIIIIISMGHCLSVANFFYVFMDRDGVEVHKLAKREREQHPAILTEQTWSIKELSWHYGKFFLHDAASSPERAR